MRDIHEPPREVAGIGRLERGVRQAFARPVRRDEVLQHRQPLAEVRRDRGFDDLARGLRHEATHAGQLPNLLFAAPGTRVRHDEDGVEAAPGMIQLLHFLEHRVRDLLRHVRPDRDDLVVAFAVRDGPFEVLLLDLDDLLASLLDQCTLLARNNQIVNPDRQARPCRVIEAEILQPVEHVHRLLTLVTEVAVLHQLLEALFLEQPVDKRQAVGQRGIEHHAPDRRRDDLAGDLLHFRVQEVLIVARHRQIQQLPADPKADRRQRFHLTGLERQQDRIG